MPNLIRLLPDHVANQIAAGEVVQRPSSVVKELIDNAIDAGATAIELIIQDAGRSLIQCIDNGQGMGQADLRMAFERHATSKIYETDDIFSIETKGFRGEALASIAAVAQVEARTKLEGEELGSRLKIEGGKFIEQEPSTSHDGTQISVRNLFYNVPARRNFLKSNAVEFRHIQDEFLRLAIAHDTIDFTLLHNGSEVYKLTASNRKKRIVQIFGRKFEEQLIPIAEQTDLVIIKGFVGKPEFAKKSRNEQFLFVNNRFIRSPFLNRAITDAYKVLLPPGKFASYFLFFTIDPKHIDINIHPSKTEIKFDDEHVIYTLLRAGVRKALGQFEVSSSLDFDTDPNWSNIPSKPNKTISAPKVHVNPGFNPFEPHSSPKRDMRPFFEQEYSVEVEQEPSQLVIETEDDYPILEWNGAYIVALINNELCVINRHRAHERIVYEQLIEKEGVSLSQRLLIPVEIPLNHQQKELLEPHSQKLLEMGFELEIEDEQLEINAVPGDFPTERIEDFFSDFLTEDLNHTPESTNEFINKKIAKSMAIRKGDYLPKEQAKNLVQQLFLLDEPNFSPGGKRIFYKLSADEIQKMLK